MQNTDRQGPSQEEEGRHDVVIHDRVKHTKIVATISDKRCDTWFLEKLVREGMDVARLNTAHMDKAGAMKVINNLRQVSDHVGILIDTKGPEIRTKDIDDPIKIEQGQHIEISGIPRQSDHNRQVLTVSYSGFHNDVSEGMRILIDDGDIELRVISKETDHLLCEAENYGLIKNKKSVNTPGYSINLPSVSEKDEEFIEFAVDNNIDFIAHSFVRNKEDMLAVQKILDRFDSTIKIIAKIENTDGVNNIDEILDHAYGIMVARGDLGIEIAAEKIPGIQRTLIKKAVQRKKPVIIATQMLHTMIEHPRPTRAEVSDVANAIYSRADAVMLSGETAQGHYPVEAVKYMTRIALEIEAGKDKRNDIIIPYVENEVVAYLSEAAIQASTELKTTAIVTNTLTGKTARYLAAFRGDKTVYAQCYNMRVVRLLSLSYGVVPSLIIPKRNRFKMMRSSLQKLIETGELRKNDVIIYVGGSFGIGGGTTFMEISTVGRLTHKT